MNLLSLLPVGHVMRTSALIDYVRPKVSATRA